MQRGAWATFSSLDETPKITIRHGEREPHLGTHKKKTIFLCSFHSKQNNIFAFILDSPPSSQFQHHITLTHNTTVNQLHYHPHTCIKLLIPFHPPLCTIFVHIHCHCYQIKKKSQKQKIRGKSIVKDVRRRSIVEEIYKRYILHLEDLP